MVEVRIKRLPFVIGFGGGQRQEEASLVAVGSTPSTQSPEHNSHNTHNSHNSHNAPCTTRRAPCTTHQAPRTWHRPVAGKSLTKSWVNSSVAAASAQDRPGGENSLERGMHRATSFVPR